MDIVEFKGLENDWDLVWECVRHNMESPAFDPQLREELRGAYNRIMDANYPDRTAPLSKDRITAGKRYRIRNIEGIKGALRGKLVEVIGASEYDRLWCRLLTPARSFRVGQQLQFDHWMLEDE